jgi:hypothetical protein
VFLGLNRVGFGARVSVPPKKVGGGSKCCSNTAPEWAVPNWGGIVAPGRPSVKEILYIYTWFCTAVRKKGDADRSGFFRAIQKR